MPQAPTAARKGGGSFCIGHQEPFVLWQVILLLPNIPPELESRASHTI